MITTICSTLNQTKTLVQYSVVQNKYIHLCLVRNDVIAQAPIQAPLQFPMDRLDLLYISSKIRIQLYVVYKDTANIYNHFTSLLLLKRCSITANGWYY